MVNQNYDFGSVVFLVEGGSASLTADGLNITGRWDVVTSTAFIMLVVKQFTTMMFIGDDPTLVTLVQLVTSAFCMLMVNKPEVYRLKVQLPKMVGITITFSEEAGGTTGRLTFNNWNWFRLCNTGANGAIATGATGATGVTEPRCWCYGSHRCDWCRCNRTWDAGSTHVYNLCFTFQ